MKNKMLWKTYMGNGEYSSMTYDEYLKTPRWLDRRKYWQNLWLFRCAVCNGKVSLQIHHRTYVRLGIEWAADVIALCPCCHYVFHENSHVFRGDSGVPYQPFLDRYFSNRYSYWWNIWDFRCAICSSDTELRLHHRNVQNVGYERIVDCIPICRDCVELFVESGRISKTWSQMRPMENLISLEVV